MGILLHDEIVFYISPEVELLLVISYAASSEWQS